MCTETQPLPPDLLRSDLGSGLILRLANPSEYERVGHTLYEAFLTNGPMTDSYKHRLTDIVARSKDEDVWVVTDEHGQLYAACTTVKPKHNRDTFEFNTMGVKSTCRGWGLGQALVKHSISVGIAFGYDRVLIHSGPNMQYAHRLYQRCGFIRHRELETMIVDGGQRLLVFIYDVEAGTRRIGRTTEERA